MKLWKSFERLVNGKPFAFFSFLLFMGVAFYQRIEYGEAHWIFVWASVVGVLWISMELFHWRERCKKFKKF